MNREQRLVRTFVELADTLVSEFDFVDLLHTLAERSVDLLEADAAGIILADQRGQLQVVASTTHEARIVELFALQVSEGPCLDCFESGRPVVNVRLDEAADRWPSFTASASEAGFRSTHALPLRLRDQVLGVVSLFCSRAATLSEDNLAVGQALADVASIGLLQERAMLQKELLAEQLQAALNSRIRIEQAKGVLAERAGVEIEEAFAMMRRFSRQSSRRLSDVATDVILGSIEASELQSS